MRIFVDFYRGAEIETREAEIQDLWSLTEELPRMVRAGDYERATAQVRVAIVAEADRNTCTIKNICNDPFIRNGCK